MGLTGEAGGRPWGEMGGLKVVNMLYACFALYGCLKVEITYLKYCLLRGDAAS